MFENGFSMRPARPRARGLKRFITMSLPTHAWATTRSSTSRSWLFSALAIADSSAFLTSVEILLSREFEVGERGRDLLAADELGEKIELLRADAQHADSRLGLVVGEAPRVGFLGHRGYALFAFLSAEWPWNVRVGANSPNLWPIISSDTSTGMCLWPL